MAPKPAPEGIRLGGHSAPLRPSAGSPTGNAESTTRLQLPVTILDHIAFGSRGKSSPPHLLRVLVSTVLATGEHAPICIVLPSAERVASVTAILASLECLAFDLPESRKAFLSRLKPGLRVRLYPTGEVFQIGGVLDAPDGARMLKLLLPDAKSRRSHATWSILSTPEQRCIGQARLQQRISC